MSATADPVTPARLMELTTGFWSFKAFAAAVELDLFGFLDRHGPATKQDVTTGLGLHERGADMLLAACASLGLLDKNGNRYVNSPLSSAYLIPGSPDYFGGFVAFCDKREYPAWQHITEALRTNRPITWDPDNQDRVITEEAMRMMRLFWDAMHSISISTATALAAAYDFGGHDRLLDVGGGSGAYPIALCGRHAHLSATVLDLAHACALAKGKIAEAGLDEVIDTVAVDFHAEPLPKGYDVVLLSQVLHDWDEGQNRALLRKCLEALEPGGTILISELMLNAERTGPPAAALMGMNMVAETPGGRNYSEAEYTGWLTDTGFTPPKVIRFAGAGANAVIVATKP